MKQIHIYVQEVVGGDKIVYTTEQKTSNPKEISDIRVELQQLQIPHQQTVLRVAYSLSHVCITIAKPSRLGRSGDYEAVWVLIPRESVYSAVEGGHFAEVIRDLESRIKSVSRPLWSELKAMDVEIDSPKGQIRASNERAGLAYRLYDEAEGYDELLKKLVQSEYSEYKAVYFLPRHLNPVGAVAKDLTTTPLKSTCILRYPSGLAEGVSLKVNGQVLEADKRFSSGEVLKLRWENPPYDLIEKEIALREDQPKKELTPPSIAEWLYPFDSDVKARFAGREVEDAQLLINGQAQKSSYTQEEWEHGLTLSFHHQDYRGPEVKLSLRETIPYHEFTERRLSGSFFEEFGYKSGHELKIDGEVFRDESWKDQAWWKETHKFELGKKRTVLKLDDKIGLKNLFKTKGDTHHLPQNYPSPNNTQGSNSSTQEQLSYYQELNRFKPRTWQIMAIVCAISLLLNIGLLGYLLYGYFTSSGEKPRTEHPTDGVGVADSLQTLDAGSHDKESLISEIKQLRERFRSQVYESGDSRFVTINKEYHQELQKLGGNLDSSSPRLEDMKLDALVEEKKKLLDSIKNVEECANEKLKTENKALAAKIDELKKKEQKNVVSVVPASPTERKSETKDKNNDKRADKPSGSGADNGN